MPAFKVALVCFQHLHGSWLHHTNGITTQLDPAKILLKYYFQSNMIQIPNKEILVTVLPESWNNHGPLRDDR